jgi:hypothetical protein
MLKGVPVRVRPEVFFWKKMKEGDLVKINIPDRVVETILWEDLEGKWGIILHNLPEVYIADTQSIDNNWFAVLVNGKVYDLSGKWLKQL